LENGLSTEQFCLEQNFLLEGLPSDSENRFMPKFRTPTKYDSDVITISRLLSDATPIYVPINTESYSRHAQCFNNVRNKVRFDGGQLVSGWLFSIYEGVYVVAIAHAIWQSPDGTLIDLTPAQQSSLNQERGLFTPQNTYPSELTDWMPIPRYFPYCLRTIWPTLAEKCALGDSLRRADRRNEFARLGNMIEEVVNRAFHQTVGCEELARHAEACLTFAS
jgi:hypothetical protein